MIKKRLILVSLGLCLLPSYALGLTWHEAITYVKTHHPDILSANEQILQTEAQVGVAKSNYYPQITASIGDSTFKVLSTNDSQNNNLSYNLTGTQTIFNGYKTLSNTKYAQAQIEIAKQQYFLTSSNIRLALKTAFIKLLTAKKLVELTETIKTRRKQNKEIVALRYQIGQEHKGSLLSAEADLENAEADARQALRQLELAKQNLVEVLDINLINTIQPADFSDIENTEDSNLKNVLTEQPDFNKLCLSHPQTQIKIAQINAATYNLAASKANFLPTLSANANIGGTSTDWENPAHTASLGMNLSLALLDGQLRNSTVKNLKSIVSQAQSNLESAKKSTLFSLQQNWTNLTNALDNISVSEMSIKAAQEREKIAQAEYSTGFITFDNWTIIEDNLVNAEKAILNTKTNAYIAQAQWIQAYGGTLDEK